MRLCLGDEEQRLNNAWQDKNAITHFSQLEAVLKGHISGDVLKDIKDGIGKAGMSIRLNPYILSLMDWSNPQGDPVRRQFLPMLSEMEPDHPCLSLDSLEEESHSPVAGLVHRYPDKVLFLVTSVCPVYCQFCTRSYAVGGDTALVHKHHVTSPQFWDAALDYIRKTPQIEDVVVSGGDVSRLKPAHLRTLGEALLGIENVRRIRFATKSLAVQPMKFLSDEEWTGTFVELVKRSRSLFKDVCLHTHFNHPNEITPVVEKAARRLHEAGVVMRNQTVLLRGVNDDPATLIALIKGLGRINIHPYYVYLCDMVKGTEHFRVPLHRAQVLDKQVRGATAGFNTPLFIADTPGGKRNIHAHEFYDRETGVSGFSSPAVAPGRLFHYFDPLRSLSDRGRNKWESGAAQVQNLVADVSRSWHAAE